MESEKSKTWFENIFITTWRPYAWIAGAGFLLYFQTLFFDFTYLDDQPLIVENYQFLSQLSNIFKAFGEDVFRSNIQAYYRPVLTISLIIDAQFGGTSLFIYHLSNIVMHLIVSGLLFLFLTKLKYKKDISFSFAILFTIHPVLTQAIAWIPGRNDSLLTAFILLTFIAFLDFVELKKWKHYIWHMLFFAIALFTKESAIIFLVPLLFYLHFIRKEKPFSFNERVLAIGWLIVIACWFSLRRFALVHPDQMNIFSLTDLLFKSLPEGLTLYIGKTILPFNLTVLPILKGSYTYGIITLILLITALVATPAKRFNFIIWGTIWFFIFLIPSFTFIAGNPIVTVALEHRIYLPLIGFIIVLLETGIIQKLSFKKIIPLIICTIVIGSFSIITFWHSNHYRNRINFWQNASQTTPKLALLHRILADMYYSEKILDKAEAELKTSLELNPSELMVHNSLGLVYMDKNMLSEAENEFKKELAVNPSDGKTMFNLRALSWLKSLETNPNNVEVLKNLVMYYYEQRNTSKVKHYVNELKNRGIQIPSKYLQDN